MIFQDPKSFPELKGSLHRNLPQLVGKKISSNIGFPVFFPLNPSIDSSQSPTQVPAVAATTAPKSPAAAAAFAGTSATWVRRWASHFVC